MSAAPLKVALSAGYGGRTVLDDVRFTLRPGEALGFAGASGAGKSTLALAVLGLLRWRGGWVRGSVELEGRDLLRMGEREARTLRGRRIALVPQSPMLALNGAVSLRTHFLESWKAHDAGGPAAMEERLRSLLPELGLPAGPEFLARRPGAISVGQAQRVLVALALLHRPAVLVADEPTSALDPVNQRELLGLLSRVCGEGGTAMLYISHDLVSVLQMCDELAVLDAGRLAERVPIPALAEAGPHCPALEAMLQALPVMPGQVRRLREATSG